jgi:hypothetical protein
MHLSVTIPEDLLNRLRAGAQTALLAPIHEPIDQASQGTLSPRFKRACALLDVIGWQADEAAEEVVIDIAEHTPALYDALSYALGDALRDLREAERSQGCACASAGGLCGQAAFIGEEDLLRASDPCVRRFHEEADALRAELEREAAEHTHRSRRPAGGLARLRGWLAGHLSGRSTSARHSGRGCHIA